MYAAHLPGVLTDSQAALSASKAALGLRVAAVQIGMSGPDHVPKGPPNLLPRRLLIDPKEGEQRSFVEGERVYQSV